MWRKKCQLQDWVSKFKSNNATTGAFEQTVLGLTFLFRPAVTWRTKFQILHSQERTEGETLFVNIYPLRPRANYIRDRRVFMVSPRVFWAPTVAQGIIAFQLHSRSHRPRNADRRAATKAQRGGYLLSQRARTCAKSLRDLPLTPGFSCWLRPRRCLFRCPLAGRWLTVWMGE